MLVEPERAQCLHKARLLYDASHDIGKAITEAEGMGPVQKEFKILAAAPDYLKGRVGRGEELPRVEVVKREEEGAIKMGNGGDVGEDEESIRGEVIKYVVGGGILKEIYYELMDMMAMKWADGRD